MLEVGKTYKNGLGYEYKIISDKVRSPLRFIGVYERSNTPHAFDKEGRPELIKDGVHIGYDVSSEFNLIPVEVPV